MKNSNNNRIIDRTINIFRDYMREEAINDGDRDAFANARSCRMVAREGGFLAKFDRAVAADPALRVFTKYDYCYGKFEDALA
jgi:hypothetical protein